VQNLETSQLLQRIKGNKAAFMPDGQALVTYDYSSGINFWEPTTGKLLQALDLEYEGGNYVYTFALSPDGKLLATSHYNGLIKLWETRNLQLVAEFKGHRDGTTSLAFTPDGALLASGGRDGTVRVWGIPSP
jgi:WD40 repeat protein